MRSLTYALSCMVTETVSPACLPICLRIALRTPIICPGVFILTKLPSYFMSILRFTNAIFMVASLCLKRYRFLASFIQVALSYHVKKMTYVWMMPSFLIGSFYFESLNQFLSNAFCSNPF